MFNKVLIAEDADYISSAVKVVLRKLHVENVHYAKYCDEAFLKLKKAKLDNEPFQLLITDLSFVDNPNEQKLKSGEDLIQQVKEAQPDIKIIVFSIEDKPFRIQKLCNELKIDAFVWKSIHGQADLKKAIKKVANQEFFISDKIATVLHKKQVVQITDFDVFVLNHLANGFSQESISKKLKEQAFKMSSISSIEKRLKILKEEFNANNPTQLVAIAKDFGLI